MKKNKIVAMGLAALMALSAGSACADRGNFKQDPIPARQTNTVQVSHNNNIWKSVKPGRIYVRHYLWSDIAGYYGSSHHTNYFQAIPHDEPKKRRGGDWMAPDSANFIRSNSIGVTQAYGCAARANTKYADDGFATIRISGYMETNNF